MRTLSGTGKMEILRLHTDQDGFVWYGDDDQLAVNSFLEADDFLAGEVAGCRLEDVSCVRLLGTRENAPLVVALQQRRAANPELNKTQRVLLGSPALAGCLALRARPVHVLQQLWQPTYSSVLSGLWHNLTGYDFCTYSMLKEMGNSEDVPEIVRRIVTYHPAWPALSFIPGVDVDAACRLVMAVVDPRWYRHPFRPHRTSRLHAHLGLSLDNMAAYLGTGQPAHNYGRAAVAVNVWHGLSNDGFLWQEYAGHKDKGRALLRTTQRMIDFVQSVWLYAVAPPHPEVAFDPHTFFRDKVTAKAYLDHLTRRKIV